MLSKKLLSENQKDKKKEKVLIGFFFDGSILY